MLGNEPSHSQMNSHVGSWNPNGFLNLHRAITWVKTHWFEKFLISLERSWNIFVWMGSHDPFGHMKHKLWPKERSGVKLVVWFWPLKIGNQPNFIVCRWRATYLWKVLDEGYKFSLDFIVIEGLHPKLWGPKVRGIPTLGISGFPFGSPRTKCYLDVAHVERRIV